MAEPFVGEIRLFAFNKVPMHWSPCNGQIVNIAQNQALFALLGTTYGGNGQTTFALPNLQGRVPIGFGSAPQLGNFSLGQVGGEQTHVLTLPEIPAHVHTVNASSDAATEVSPAGAVWAQAPDNNPYAATPGGLMNQGAVGITGGTQAHPNMQPYNVLQYCIAMQGYFPVRD